MRLLYLECGKILAPHGVLGGVKIETWCDAPADAASLPSLYFASRDGQYTRRRLLRAAVHGRGILAFFEGIETPEEAAALRGVTVYARREDLDPTGKKVFLAELAGLPLTDARDGRLYGYVREADTSRKTLLYVVDTPRGEVLFPAVPEFIKEIDMDRGISVVPIPGLFDGLSETDEI